jgi:hypothetical protein
MRDLADSVTAGEPARDALVRVFPVRVEACQAYLHPPATGLPAVTAASRNPAVLFIERSLIAPGCLTRHRRCPRRAGGGSGPPGRPPQCPSPQPGPGPAPDRRGPRRVAARGRAAGQHRHADRRRHAGRRHRWRRPRARRAGRRGGRPDRRACPAPGCLRIRPVAAVLIQQLLTACLPRSGAGRRPWPACAAANTCERVPLTGPVGAAGPPVLAGMVT